MGDQFQRRGDHSHPSALSIRTSARVRTKIGGVDSFARRSRPSTAPRSAACFQEGRFLHRRSWTNVRKTIKVAIPSVVTNVKLAINDGENAKRASTRLAAPSEKIAHVLNHKRAPSKTPSATLTRRTRMAIPTGSVILLTPLKRLGSDRSAQVISQLP